MAARRQPTSARFGQCGCASDRALARVLDALAASEAAELRRCENPGCRRPLIGLRADARCCSGACRAEVSRLRRANGNVRFCANPACAKPLDPPVSTGHGRRKDARCCSASCRAALSRLRRRQEEIARSEAFWASFGALPRRRVERASRRQDALSRTARRYAVGTDLAGPNRT